MNDSMRRRDLSRLILGLAVCALGVLFTLDRMDVLDAGSLIEYWPLFLVAIGVSRLLQAPGGSGRGFGLVLVVVGSWLLLYNLELVDFGIRDVWPVVLVLVGVGMVWRALGGDRRRPCCPEPETPTPFDPMAPPPPPATGDAGPPPMAPPAASDDYVDGLAVLGGFKRVVTSKRFQGGSLTAFMGGCEVDLRRAGIEGDSAVIDTLAFWGGITIYVPEDWAVELRGTPVLGGFEDKTRGRHGGSAKTLIIKGFAVMGGVEVKD
ncbi:MAG: LiaI-LiaF-like domain-containing protein [Thermoanaerobaculaceae bacterium]